MKTNFQFSIITLFLMIFGSFQTKLNAQSQAGQGNFNIPELKVIVSDPSACNTSDAKITISEPLGTNYQYSINNGAFQSSPNFLNLAPGQYIVKYYDYNLSCTSKDKVVDINPIPCDLQPRILCDVFVNLKGLILTETSFNIVMPDNISEILDNLQLSNGSIANILSQISSLDINLEYTTATGNQSEMFNIYNSSMYGDLSSFRIKSWAYEVIGVNTANFTGSYQLKLTLTNGEVLECSEYPLNLSTETIEEDTPQPINGLPLLDCNSTLSELPDDAELLPALNEGELVYIKEFPILLTTVKEPKTGGKYSGTGIIPLPFDSRYILVRFDNVEVSKTRKIKGTVYAIPGSPVACSAPSVDFGGAICIPPPPPPSFSGPGGTDINGYNSYGFDPVTGKYKDGTLFDPNGFDFNGNYQGTEPPSPFNPQGCNRDGIDINGNECDPTPNPPNPEVIKFLEDNDGSFGPTQNSILQQLKQEYMLKLQNLNCEQFRTNMNNALNGFQDVSTVKGSSNQYFDSGLSSNFGIPLKPSDYDDSRLDPNIKTIGSNHAKLYDCDLKSIKYNKIVARINIILANQTLHDQILDDIKEVMKRWSPEELTKYGDVESQAFKDWMKERLKEKIMELENDNTLFSYLNIQNPSKKPYNILPIDNAIPYTDYYSSIASLDKEFGNKLSPSEKEEIAFYLENGFNSIKGIDRVHYLAAMTQGVSSNSTVTPNVMPLKISASTGSMIYTVYLDQFEFTPTNAIFDACIKIEDTDSGKILVFRAENIAFGPGGTTDPFRLSLVNDQVSLRINNASKIHLYKDKTFVEFDCDGFVRAGIKADVEFCPEYILPLDANGKVIANTNYKLHIPELVMNKWMEFTFTMDAKPFAMTKYENIQWELSKMVIDTDSGAGTSVTITPPVGYESAVSPSSGSWKGFYVQNLKVKFLPELPSNTGSPVEVDIQNLIIDGTGVSAYASVEKDILNNGNMSGWPFSINKVTLLVLHNNVAGFGFGGDLKLPVFKNKLGYLAEVYSGGKYKFAVTLAKDLECPLFIATANIYDDSEVGVVYDGTKFIATARLNGDIKVSKDLIPGVNGVFPSINFTGMEISTKAPYFNIGTWDVKGDGVSLDFGAFAMSIGLPRGYKPGGDASNGVTFPVRLELDGKYKIYASGDINVLGLMSGEGGGIHNWDYTGFQIGDKFCIGGSFPGVKSISGCLKYFKPGDPGVDAKWGTGFQAAVKVEFEKFLDRIDAVGCFGRAPEGYKYFFVDATASLKKSIPLGAISLNGFCGGVSNRMSSTFDPGALNFTDAFDPETLPIGSSASGILYTPNEASGIGLKAGATFVLSSLPSLTNGSILIKMDFAAAGGLQEFGMKGTAKFLEVPAELLPFVAAAGRPDIEAVIAANVDLKVNGSGVFGKFECYLNAPPIMEGIGSNGKLVDAVVKFTASEWYIWIGTPEKRSGVDILGIMKVQSYFCMGSKIPNFPDIPYEIRKHIPSFASASGLRGGGGGLVFGSSFDVGGTVNALVAKGNFRALGGFDIMLRNYSNMNCGGAPIGLNGWYGAGQAWAMLSGNVDAFGINVFSATIAAAFQARLPKPTFIQAALHLEACFIKCFDVDFDVTIGEACNFQSNNPNNALGTEIIANVIPFTNTQDLALESKPQVFFNVPIKDGVKIKDLSGNEKTYNVRIKKLEMNSLTLEIPISFETSFNNTSTLANLLPKYLLPHSDSIELIIEAEVLEGSNVIQTELKRLVFHTTSNLPNFANNIKTSYPLEGMTNFYKDEVNEEFIVLKQILYDYIEGTEADLKIKLCPKGSNNGQDIPFTVVDYGSKFTFDISPYLATETHYELKIFEIKSSQEGQSQSERELVSIPFRTSKFETFADKVASFDPVNDPLTMNGKQIFTHKIQFTSEPFDDIEINNKLVRAELGSEDYTKIYLDEFKGYTTYGDEYVEEYCKIQRFPGYAGGALSVQFTKDMGRYNVNWKGDYRQSIVGFLKKYMDMIEHGLGYIPPTADVYHFYLQYSNFRDNQSSGVRAELDPNMILMYYTPDGQKMSFQEVK